MGEAWNGRWEEPGGLSISRPPTENVFVQPGETNTKRSNKRLLLRLPLSLPEVQRSIPQLTFGRFPLSNLVIRSFWRRTKMIGHRGRDRHNRAG